MYLLGVAECLYTHKNLPNIHYPRTWNFLAECNSVTVTLQKLSIYINICYSLFFDGNIERKILKEHSQTTLKGIIIQSKK